MLIPDLFQVIDLPRISIENRISILGSHDEIFFGAFNVSRDTGLQSTCIH